MSQPILSILIPTVYGREKSFINLTTSLQGQIQALYQSQQIKSLNDIVIISEIDDKRITIGEKRESLYKAATGKYSLQVDDDDDIAHFGIRLIMEAIKQNPDCVTYEEYVNIDGKEFKSNHSIHYGGWEGDGNKLLDDGFHYHRTAFFKSVIRTDIARKVPIPHCRFGEDNMWADALAPHLQTEIHIPEQIYRYIHVSSDSTERYGLNK